MQNPPFYRPYLPFHPTLNQYGHTGKQDTHWSSLRTQEMSNSKHFWFFGHSCIHFPHHHGPCLLFQPTSTPVLSPRYVRRSVHPRNADFVALFSSCDPSSVIHCRRVIPIAIRGLPWLEYLLLNAPNRQEAVFIVPGSVACEELSLLVCRVRCWL